MPSPPPSRSSWPYRLFFLGSLTALVYSGLVHGSDAPQATPTPGPNQAALNGLVFDIWSHEARFQVSSVPATPLTWTEWEVHSLSVNLTASIGLGDQQRLLDLPRGSPVNFTTAFAPGPVVGHEVRLCRPADASTGPAHLQIFQRVGDLRQGVIGLMFPTVPRCEPHVSPNG